MVSKIFKYESEEFGAKIKVLYELELPLPDFCSFNEVFGHFVCKTKLMEPFHKGARHSLNNFIRAETQNYYNQLAEGEVLTLLNEETDLDTNNIYSLLKMDQQPENLSQIVKFNSDFQYVMENCKNDQLMRLITIEQEMSNEMKSLITARDFELDRLRRACEETIEKTSEMSDKIEENSYNLSVLNEKLRKCNTNYCHQQQAMIERHKNEFAELIRCLKLNGTVPVESFDKFSTLRKQKSIKSEDSRSSFTQVDFKKMEESFTIYIGAQLKSMHNARIIKFDRLIDVCHSPLKGDFLDDVHNSRRLHSLMSLYGRDLSAAVLLVDRDPLYHLHANTKFFRLCERSAELHFDNLSEQLKKIVSLVRSTNKRRKTFNPAQQSFEHVNEVDDDDLLKPGDVYITVHSNLSNVQVIFHLVSDKSLESTDINSRHPCVNGLKNCVRLAARNAIKTLSFPLFLVEEMKPNMTVNWCINRSELIFKCMKGFLMEICSSGASSTANVPTSSKPIHYNINFVVPKLNRDVFESVVEMFPNIFHLVPIVNNF